LNSSPDLRTKEKGPILLTAALNLGSGWQGAMDDRQKCSKADCTKCFFST